MSALTSENLDGYHEDPLINSPFALVSTVNISLTYMLWYVVVTHWSLANYVSWVRYNDALLGNYPSSRVYLAFVVIAEVLLWGFGGPLMFYAAKYRKSQKDRNRILFLGVALFFLMSDVPLFACDISIIYYYSFQSVVQTVTLILRSISFFMSATIAWQMYVHRMVKFLHTVYDNSEERGKVAKQQEVEAERKARGIRTQTKLVHQLVR